MSQLRPIPVSFIGQAHRPYDLDAFLSRHTEIVPESVSYLDESEDPAFSEEGDQHFVVKLGVALEPDAAAKSARAFLLRHLAALEEFSREGGQVTVQFGSGIAAIVEMGTAACRHISDGSFTSINLSLSYSLSGDEDDPEEDGLAADGGEAGSESTDGDEAS